MPELPEVQTVINGLQEKITGKTVTELRELRPGTVVWHVDKKALGEIRTFSRRGKYIIINTDMNYKIVIHLRMTGKLIFEKDYNFTPLHARAEFIFSDETKLIFNDRSRYRRSTC